MIRLLFTKSRSLSTSPRQRLSLAFNPLLPGPAIRLFRTSVACRAIKPFLLADIGEGTTSPLPANSIQSKDLPTTATRPKEGD